MSGTLLTFGWQYETDVQCVQHILAQRQVDPGLLACTAYSEQIELVSPKLRSQASFYGRSIVLHLFEGDIKGRTFEIK